MTKEWYLAADKASMAKLPKELKFLVTGLGGNSTPLVPSVEGEEVWLVGSYYIVTRLRVATEQGIPQRIYPPNVTQRIHYPSGRFEWLTPGSTIYGGPALPLDERGMPSMGLLVDNKMTLEEDEWASDNYLSLVCLVVARRWLLTAYPVTEEERDTARKLQFCVRALYDEALMPYYRYYGYHFLAWIERAAK